MLDGQLVFVRMAARLFVLFPLCLLSCAALCNVMLIHTFSRHVFSCLFSCLFVYHLSVMPVICRSMCLIA